MPNVTKTIVAAIALNLATLAPVVALEAPAAIQAPQGSVVPGVISAAYGDPSIAKTPSEAFRQGGFSVAAATRWVAAPQRTVIAEPFTAPGVISVAYRNRSISTSASAVAAQGGYKVAGAVRWTATPGNGADDVETIRLGAL